jgi:hypothetical protein
MARGIGSFLSRVRWTGRPSWTTNSCKIASQAAIDNTTSTGDRALNDSSERSLSLSILSSLFSLLILSLLLSLSILCLKRSISIPPSSSSSFSSLVSVQFFISMNSLVPFPSREYLATSVSWPTCPISFPPLSHMCCAGGGTTSTGILECWTQYSDVLPRMNLHTIHVTNQTAHNREHILRKDPISSIVKAREDGRRVTWRIQKGRAIQ